MEEEDLIPYNLVYGSDYFVVLDEKDIDRLNCYFAYPYDGEYIIYDEFLKKKFK